MAKRGSPNINIVTTIKDLKGKVVLKITKNEYIVIKKDGSVISYNKHEYIQLVDGLAWSPDMLNHNPPVHIGVCEMCRNPGFSLFGPKTPTSGLVCMSRAKQCECGVLCCPQHRELCADKRWRCLKCAEKFKGLSLLNKLFLKKADE